MRYLTLASLFCSAFGSLTFVVMFTLTYFGNDIISYKWVVSSGDGFEEVCDPVILARPEIDEGAVTLFAQRTAVGINSYNYLSWDKELPKVLEESFSPRAARFFLYQFERSSLLERVIKNYYTVSALSTHNPVITASVDLGGNRQWTVQVPITVYYKTGALTDGNQRTKRAENYIYQIEVVEQSPTSKNYRGVSVVGITSWLVSNFDQFRDGVNL